MRSTKMLKEIGKLIAKFLLALFLIKLLILLFQFMVLQSITLDTFLERLVLFMLPTEATIIETFVSYPAAMLIILFYYIKFVKE